MLLRLVGAAAASLALSLGTATPAHADEAATGACTGVWVAVDEASPRCAADFATGRAALESAGYAIAEKSPGFLCRLDGVPEECTVSATSHWSYWQASRGADGSWGPWTYSPVGYTASQPARGDAEGWVFGDGKTPPPPLPEDPATAATPSTAAPQAPRDAGSPVHTLATLGVLGAGGAALGGWWARNRRGA